MIQNTSSLDRVVSGNMQGEDIKMGVADMAHLLNVVTDLYSDREGAVIREYSTNAWDAHVEAGVTRPIEVNTPTALRPFIEIRDFGVGMTLEDIRVTYSQYGASTKRNTNDQTGMLGLGCKSALTYSDQFTVTSVKDGVRVQVVVSRNSQGASMKVVDTSQTSDPNGTTVIVPAKSYNGFDIKARKFFSFWEPELILLNGQKPERVPGAKWVTDDLAIIDGHQNYIVMGGVPYPAAIRHGLGYGQSVVAFVPIGAVDFAPSRESLMDSDTTEDTLIDIQVRFQAALRQAVLDDIAAATDALDSIRRKQDWARKLPHTLMPRDVFYGGKRIPSSIDVPKGTLITDAGSSKLASHSTVRDNISVERVLSAVWVVGYDRPSFTATHKKKLNHFIENSGGIYGDVPYYILSEDEPSMEWLDKSRIVKWEDIASIKLPRLAPNPTTGRIPGSYDLWEAGAREYGVPAEDIDATKPVFYTLDRGGHRQVEYVTRKHPGCTVVQLQTNRLAKFKRLFPNARPLMEPIKAEYEVWKAGLDQDMVRAYAANNTYTNTIYNYLDASKVDDPDVKAAIQLKDTDTSALKAEAEAWQKLGFYWNPDQSGTLDAMAKYPLVDYPHFRRERHADHAYAYMNDAYQRSLGKTPTWS